MGHFGNFCSISYIILSAPGAEYFLVSLRALLSSCRSNGSFKLFSFSLYSTSAVFLWNWFSNNCLWFDSISFLCETKVLLWLYSAPLCSHCKRCTSYGNSVCLSVCLFVCPSVHLSVSPSARPSHAGIASKRQHVARCSLHCRLAKCV